MRSYDPKTLAILPIEKICNTVHSVKKEIIQTTEYISQGMENKENNERVSRSH